MKKKVFRLLALLSLAVVFLVACGNGESDSSQSSSQTEEATSEVASSPNDESEEERSEDSQEEGESTEASGETITIYSNTLNDEEREAFVTQLAEEAGFSIEVVPAGGSDTYNRVLAEANDPQADVVIGMDEANWLNIVDEGIVRAYEPSWASEIPEEYIVSENGEFYPFAQSLIFALYNPEHVEEADVPETLEALGQDEKYAQQYRVPDALGGSTDEKILLSILMQYPDENGELGISEEGWKALQAYIDNAYIAREDEDVWQMTKDGDLPFNYYHASGTTLMQEEYDMTLRPINPPYGVFTMHEQIGLLDKGEDHDYSEAERFIDWFGSADLQAQLAAEFGFLPLIEEARESATPALLELVEQTDPMEVDWDLYRENVDQWIEKIELDMMP